jgi:hypothetical protein
LATLKVLVTAGAVEIPKSLIKKRWTVSARDGLSISIPGFSEAVARDADGATMHGVLHAAAMELVGMGTTSRQAFEVAIEYVSQCKKSLSEMVVVDPGQVKNCTERAPGTSTDAFQFDVDVAAPPRVRSRGRPKELRFKSPIESPGSNKRPAKQGTNNSNRDGQMPRRTTRFLKTGVVIREHCAECGSTQHLTGECLVENEDGERTATRRRCKSCGEVGHNRSTCGRRSTYTPKL